MTEISPPTPAPRPEVFRALVVTPTRFGVLSTSDALAGWTEALEKHGGVPADNPEINFYQAWLGVLGDTRMWIVTGNAYRKEGQK